MQNIVHSIYQHSMAFDIVMMEGIRVVFSSKRKECLPDRMFQSNDSFDVLLISPRMIAVAMSVSSFDLWNLSHHFRFTNLHLSLPISSSSSSSRSVSNFSSSIWSAQLFFLKTDSRLARSERSSIINRFLSFSFRWIYIFSWLRFHSKRTYKQKTSMCFIDVRIEFVRLILHVFWNFMRIKNTGNTHLNFAFFFSCTFQCLFTIF